MSNRVVKLCATFFYAGYLPFAPGTMASVAGFLLYIFLCRHMTLCALAFLFIVLVGFLTSGKIERLLNEKDPSCVVIDEVSGAMIAIFMLPLTPSVIVTAFFLFRAFDMFKIYPIDKLEDLKGATGIMMDDIIAGVYTNVTMQVALQLKGLFSL